MAVPASPHYSQSLLAAWTYYTFTITAKYQAVPTAYKLACADLLFIGLRDFGVTLGAVTHVSAFAKCTKQMHILYKPYQVFACQEYEKLYLHIILLP